jgi:tetratricopeptide (TPR) repeat protein
MAKFTEDDVRVLARAIKRERDERQRGVAFLTGAGCSLTAGIPLAAQLVEEIKKKYPDEIKRLVKPEQQDDYGCCMGALALGERKELLEPYLREAKINWAHIALASLIRAEFVRRILTFNFDSVLARACGLLARYPAIYDFGVSPSERMDYLAEPCIVHLHGQGYGPIMMNSEEETRAHAQKLRPLIDDTFSKFPLVVVGYGGESDKVFEEIVAAYAGQHRLYWLGFDEEPKARLRALLEGAKKNYIHYYGGADADAILIALAQKLDCFPPLAFSDPAAHLFEERTGIAEFPLGATDLKYDLLKESQARLKQGGKNLKLDEISVAALRGDSEEIVKRERATPAGEKSLVPPKISAWALISSGHAHLKKGQDERSLEQLEFAASDYKKAAESDPQNPVAFASWGVAIAERARLRNDEALYREAIDKHEAALRLKPDYADALASWASALEDLARMKNDEALYREAIDKFEAALRFKPDFPEALAGWGGALFGLARLRNDEALNREAIDKFEAALRLKPDLPEALTSWGAALARLARLRNDEALYREAIDKHKSALRLKPDLPEALTSWGAALTGLARLRNDEALYREAIDKCEAALRLRADFVYALLPLGTALAGLARMKRDQNLYREAIAKFDAALQSKPDYAEALESLGGALLDLWEIAKEDELLDRARVALDRQEQLDPRRPYNRARLAAILGDEEGCRLRLSRAKAAGMLPRFDILKSDFSLEAVREKQWFKEILGE